MVLEEAAGPLNTFAWSYFVNPYDNLEFLGLRVRRMLYTIRDRQYLCAVHLDLRDSAAQWESTKSVLVRNWGEPVYESNFSPRHRSGRIGWKSASGMTLAELVTTPTLHADGKVTYARAINFDNHVADRNNVYYGGIP
jgi:hypothetical protein